MLHIACCLWDANDKTPPNSRCFDETWVDKLHRGFERNLTVPFRTVCFTDRARKFREPVWQMALTVDVPDFGCLIEPFRLDLPMIVCGLDTVVVGNVDVFAEYCMNPQNKIALPRNPYQPTQSINPVVLSPAHNRNIYSAWNGENDMEHLRRFPWSPLDDLFPGAVLSLKYHRIRATGVPPGTKIVYFHGQPKVHELTHLKWVQEHSC